MHVHFKFKLVNRLFHSEFPAIVFHNAGAWENSSKRSVALIVGAAGGDPVVTMQSSGCHVVSVHGEEYDVALQFYCSSIRSAKMSKDTGVAIICYEP